MIEVQVKVWRDYAQAFEKCMEEHKEFRLRHLDCTNRHSLYYTATVETPFQWDLFNVLVSYGPLVDNSLYFELECHDKDSAEMVHDILADRHFACSIGKRAKTRVRLVMQNGYEGLDQARSYLREFGLKLCRQHGKMVWNVKGV